MSFYLVTSANGRFGANPKKATSQAILDGQVLIYDVSTGNVIPADNTTTFAQAEFVSTEAITAPQALANVHALKISENDQYIVDTVNNSSTAHNGQRMILDATGTLANNTGTDSSVGVVRQVGVIGAPSNRQILCEFVTK